MNDRILEFYKDEGLTVGKIAERLHLPYGVVKDYLKMKGIDVGKRGMSEEEVLKKKPQRKNILRFLIENGWSITALAKEYKVPWKAAKLWADKEGVPERPLRKMEKEQFTRAMERWAEFIMEVNNELEGGGERIEEGDEERK